MEEENLVDKAIPTSTKYKNKWTDTIFNEYQTVQNVQVPYWIPKACLKIVMICRRYGSIVFELLAEQNCPGSSEKEWRKVSSKDWVLYRLRESNATLKR